MKMARNKFPSPAACTCTCICRNSLTKSTLKIHCITCTVHVFFFFNRDNDIEECGLEMYFAQDYDVLGVVNTHELVEGGAEKLVTNENKNEYIE